VQFFYTDGGLTMRSSVNRAGDPQAEAVRVKEIQKKSTAALRAPIAPSKIDRTFGTDPTTYQPAKWG